MENPIKMDDLGGKPPIFGNIHIHPRYPDFLVVTPHKVADRCRMFALDESHPWPSHWPRKRVLVPALKNKRIVDIELRGCPQNRYVYKQTML